MTASLTTTEGVQLLAGALRCVNQEVSEELIMCGTMVDLITPKLDVPLLSDLFPSMEQPPTPASALRLALEADLAGNNLQVLLATASLLQSGTVNASVLAQWLETTMKQTDA